MADHRAARAKLDAEAGALKELLAEAAGGDHSPVLDEMNAMIGYEVALGAALGDDLSAPLEADAPFTWRGLPPLADGPLLPPGVESLSRFVTAPAALARRLARSAWSTTSPKARYCGRIWPPAKDW